MALIHKTDIIPVSTVNAEFINPWTYSSQIINKFMRTLGIPFLPLGLILVPLLLQPWIFYFAFPAKLHFVVGRRITPSELTNKPVEEMSIADFRAIAERVRRSMQDDLNAAVEAYGKHPFKLKELFKRLIEQPSLLFKTCPIFWPIFFNEHNRLYEQRPGSHPVELRSSLGSVVRGLFKNPFCLFFFVPVLGWLPIALRGFKKIASKRC